MRTLHHHPLRSSLLALASLAPTAAASDGYCITTPISPDSLVSSDLFGDEVARDGKLFAARASTAEEIYVYELQGSSWVLLDRIENPADLFDGFGRSLDVCGDRVLVGAAGDDTLSDDAGRAYLYERSGDEFVLVETFQESAPEEDARFGTDVALTEGWIAISSPSASVGGHVRLYLELAGGWQFVDEIATTSDSWFGGTLELFENDPLEVTLFIADEESDFAGPAAGGVHHYVVSPGETLYYGSIWPTGTANYGRFGSSLAYDGAQLVVGAKDDSTMGSQAGAVYVWDLPYETGSKHFVKKLFAPDSDAIDQFGWSVDVREGQVAAGAIGQGTVPGSGRVHVFAPNVVSGVLQLDDTLEPLAPIENGRFGFQVAFGEQGLLVGTTGTHQPGKTNTGDVCYVSLAPTGGLTGACPCDAIAGVQSYGEGKPGSLGVPALTSTVPVPGGFHTVGLSNLVVGTVPLLLWSETPANLPFDDGTLLVGNPNLDVLPVVGPLGKVGAGWMVPFDQPALCGLDLFAQAIVLDPGAAGPYSTAQSNGLRMTIGF